MTKQKNQVQDAPIARGAYLIRKQEDGFQVEISVGSLPLPTKRFAAQCFRVDSEGPGIEFKFGQRLGKRISSVVAIQIEPADFVGFHNSLSSNFRDAISRQSQPYKDYREYRISISDAELDLVPVDRHVVLTATLGYLEITNGAALFDWYEIPARTLRTIELMRETKLQEPEPVIEIRCSLPILQAFIDRVDDVRKQIDQSR